MRRFSPGVEKSRERTLFHAFKNVFDGNMHPYYDTPMIYRMADLRHYLIDGQTGWMESFQIIDTQRRLWNDKEIIFYALGTSHAVSILQQGKQLTELLSCRGHLEIGRGVAEIAASKPCELSTTIHGFKYRFHLSLYELEGDDLLRGQFAREDEITIAYPKQPNLATPITKIGWRIEPLELRIETLHTYPEDMGGVRSESVFQIA